MSSSGGELRHEDYSTILKEVKSLSGQVDDDSRASFRLKGGERGQKKEKGNFHSSHLRLIKCATVAAGTEIESGDWCSFYPSEGRFQEVVERPDCPGEGVGDGPASKVASLGHPINCSIRSLYRLK